jgi:hypothetical protein
MPPLSGPPLTVMPPGPLDFSCSSSNSLPSPPNSAEIKRKRRTPKTEAREEDKRKKRIKRGLTEEEDNRSPVSGTFIRRLSDVDHVDAKRGEIYEKRRHFLGV